MMGGQVGDGCDKKHTNQVFQRDSGYRKGVEQWFLKNFKFCTKM